MDIRQLQCALFIAKSVKIFLPDSIVIKKDWDPVSQKIFSAEKDTTPLNKNLDLILRRAHDCFDELKFSGITFSIDELVDKIKDKEQVPILLLEYIEHCNQKDQTKSGC
jgi:hypothetical protein